MRKLLLPLLGIMIILNGCAYMSASDKAEKRKQLDTMTGSTIMRLLKQYPDLQSEIEAAPGYMVAYINAATDNAGEGVIIASKSKQHYYFTIGGVEIVSGWGSRSFKILLILNSQEMLDDFTDDKQAINTVAGSAEKQAVKRNDEYTVYVMSDSGIAVTDTVTIIDFKLNHALMHD